MRDLLLAVLLPIALAAAWVAWRVWCGRPPGRPLLNAVFSLLLAAYALATAGLGLFWVANQHLPVFDWHYVFGYAMLVLLAVHLAFNARALWFHLRRGGALPAAAARPREARPGRRPLLGALGGAGVFGAALAAGLGYLLGLRHGRTEVHFAAAPERTAAADVPGVVEPFHALSSHSRRGLATRAPSTDWGAAVPPFKADPAAALVLPLGPPGQPAPAGVPAVMARDTLAALLWHTAGVREWRGGIAFRAAPSSGALFATELYVAARDVDGLAAGLWHYRPDRHVLALLRAGEPGQTLVPPGAAAAVWATAVFRRSGRKYGDRTYRYVLADLGHALENLRQAGAHAGLGLRWLEAFDERATARELGVDERDEGVLAGVLLDAPSRRGTDLGVTAGTPPLPLPPSGPGSPPRVAAPTMPAFAAAPSTAAASSASSASSATPAALGVTAAIHAASSVRVPVPLPSRPDRPVAPLPRTDGELALPAATPLTMPVWQRIAQRRSRRRYRPQPIPLPVLGTLLDALQPQHARLSAGVRVHVLTPAVASLPSGVWRYEPARHALQPRRRIEHEALRRLARAAALDQDAAGAAAVVVVLSIDRAAWSADALGPARGYRHALIEAGMVGERAYLAASALGMAVCGIGAFFDDELAGLLAIDAQHEWPVHLVALGLPADG